MRTIGPLALLLVLMACAKPASREKFQIRECPSGFSSVDNCETNLSWEDGAHIHFAYADSVPQVARPQIQAAATDYNLALASTRLFVGTPKDPAPAFTGDVKELTYDGVNGIYFLSEPWPFPTSKDSDAMTVIAFDRQHIIGADIFFRAQSYALEDVSKKTLALKFVKLIGVHEMGHVLGLNHSHAHDAVMQSFLSVAFADQSLGASDLLVLSRQYSLRPGVL